MTVTTKRTIWRSAALATLSASFAVVLLGNVSTQQGQAQQTVTYTKDVEPS
jgi:hypothetical protein